MPRRIRLLQSTAGIPAAPGVTWLNGICRVACKGTHHDVTHPSFLALPRRTHGSPRRPSFATRRERPRQGGPPARRGATQGNGQCPAQRQPAQFIRAPLSRRASWRLMAAKGDQWRDSGERIQPLVSYAIGNRAAGIGLPAHRYPLESAPAYLAHSPPIPVTIWKIIALKYTARRQTIAHWIRQKE